MPHRDPGRAILATIGAYACAVALLTGTLGFTTRTYPFFDFTDIGLYHQYAVALDAKLRPFVHFPAEYPSAALRLFALPGHPADLASYRHWFAGLMFVALGAAALLVTLASLRLWRRGTLAGIGFAASVLAAGAIVANRYDAAVALCIALFLWATSARKWLVAGVAVGLGTALKLTPIVLVPLPLLLASSRRDRALFAAAFGAAAALPFLADGSAAFRGIATVFRYHGTRPLQIESVLATPLLLAKLAGLADVSYGTASGAQTIIGPGAAALAKVSGVLAAACVAAVVALAARARRSGMDAARWIVLVTAGLMLGVVVPSKVLSPQYVVWLLPVVPLAAHASRPLSAALFVGVLLTGIEFPALYWSLLRFEPAAILVVVVRNAALVVALACALASLALASRAVRGAPARSRDVSRVSGAPTGFGLRGEPT